MKPMYYRADLGEPWHSTTDYFIDNNQLYIPRNVIEVINWDTMEYDNSINSVIVPPYLWHTEEDMKLFGYL